MSLVAIITSVIGEGYYLNIIKKIFFYFIYQNHDISNKILKKNLIS